MTDTTHSSNPQSRTPRPRGGPLAGIRVADFSWVGVGSIATRMLADYGAEVIKIESRTRLDLARQLPLYKGKPAKTYVDQPSDFDPDCSGVYNNIARNKLGLSLDLADERGREIAARLIAVSDVVTENFAPGVMEKWGFDYAGLRLINPSVIFARMSGYGLGGPSREYRSFGPVVQAVSGLTHISGLPGREPSGWGLSYMDHMAGYYGSAAVLMALYERAATNEGCELDLSATEIGVTLLGPVLFDVGLNGRSTRRDGYPFGNRAEYVDAAPHGVYRCAGEDRWIAISVCSDDEWRGLRRAMGDPLWCHDTDLDRVAGRLAASDWLDKRIEEWTSGYDRHGLMGHLQEHGVRAAAVQDAEDLNEIDPQLAHRGLFFDLDHPKIGPARFEGSPFRLSRVQPDHWRSAPLLGEDNRYVLRDILGYSEQQIDELTEDAVL